MARYDYGYCSLDETMPAARECSSRYQALFCGHYAGNDYGHRLIKPISASVIETRDKFSEERIYQIVNDYADVGDFCERRLAKHRRLLIVQ